MKDILSFTVISNITLAIHFDKYMKDCFCKYNLKIHYIRYGEHNEEMQKEIISNSDYVIVWMNYEELCNESIFIDRSSLFKQIQTKCVDLRNDIKGIYRKKVIWLLFENYYDIRDVSLGSRYDDIVDRLNLKLLDYNCEEIVFMDLKRVIAKLGIEQSYDFKSKYRWNAPYSKILIETVVGQVYKQFLIDHNKSKKCLVLDCDNVLWDGIISEDGIENIRLANTGLGKIHRDFQKFVLNLYEHGVILAICSKNDFEDVMYMLRNHSGMILKEDHFAVIKANWESKVDNLIEISNELNISLDSMVFVDDSAFEIQAVNCILPEVTTILFEKKDIYSRFSCFSLEKKLNLVQIKQRNETYQTNYRRKELLKRSSDYSEYLDALEMKIDIHRIEIHELNRVAELTLRTNKLTNGRRYTVEDIKNLLKMDNYELYVIYLSDRFSELGLVGAIGIKGKVIDLISLSCRAMGRNIEQFMMDFAKKKNVSKVYCTSTEKNESFQFMMFEKFELILDMEKEE